MYEKILVPLDGSDLAEVALPYVEELAGRLGSEITLLYVGESPESSYQRTYQFYIEKTAETTKEGAERYIEKTKGKAIKVKPRILVGNPAEEIVEYASREDIGLIVLATHGRSGINRWSLGSVADKVVRATDRPVVLIRAKGAQPDMREKGILNKALVPLDGSEEAEAVIPYIEELASKLKAEVILLQVMSTNYQAIAEEEYGYVIYTDKQIESDKAFAKDYLEKVSARLKQKGVAVKSEVRFGVAAEEIIKLADEIYADVVAMSTHGRSGVGRWFFSSVADRILHEGHSPLLLVRSSGVSMEYSSQHQEGSKEHLAARY
ncbi:universal stress protein [Chloroflexota bacterium]